MVLDYLANARDGHKAFRIEYYDADRGGYSFHDFRLLALSVAADGSARFKLARGAQTPGSGISKEAVEGGDFMAWLIVQGRFRWGFPRVHPTSLYWWSSIVYRQ